MEPQGRGTVSCSLHAETKQDTGPEEDHSRIESARSIMGLNAEKIFRHRADGEVFLLTFLFIGLVRVRRLSGGPNQAGANTSALEC